MIGILTYPDIHSKNMTDSSTKFRVYLVFEDGSSYGVSLSREIRYAGLVSYVKKKFKYNKGYEVGFSYKMPHGQVNIVDDDDVEFFINEVCKPKAALPKLLINVIVKSSKVNPSSSKSIDFDLNDPLFHNNFDPQIFYNDSLRIEQPKNEHLENHMERVEEPKKEHLENYMESVEQPKNETFENYGSTSSFLNHQIMPKWQTSNPFKYMPTPPDPPSLEIKIPNTLTYNTNGSVILKEGDEFEDKNAIMYAIGEKALLERFEFKPRKTDKFRYDVICVHAECKWKILSSLNKDGVKWSLGKVYDVHTCSRTQVYPNHRNATKKLLGHLLFPKLKDSSRIYRPIDIMQDINEQYNIDISYKKAWAGKNRALELVNGCPKESFEQLPYYCHNLKLKNEGTVTHIDTDDEGHFKMCFIGFGVAVRIYLFCFM